MMLGRKIWGVLFFLLCALISPSPRTWGETPAIPTVINSGETITVTAALSGEIDHNITVKAGGKLIIEPGATLSFVETIVDSKRVTQRIIVEAGGILEIGGPGAPCILRAAGYPGEDFRYSGWYGIANSGSLILKNTTIWGAEYGVFQVGGTTLIETATIDYCSNGITSKDGVVKIFSSTFNNNHEAVAVTDVAEPSLLCGNHFSNNGVSLKIIGTNYLNVRNNQFDNTNQNAIYLQNKATESGEVFWDNSQVYFSFNNFNYHLTETDLYMVYNISASEIALYNCYWQSNDRVYLTETEIKGDNLVTEKEKVLIKNILSSPVTITTDTTPPTLVELNPTAARPGFIDLSVVISDVGWGVDLESIIIKLYDSEGLAYHVALGNTLYNNRQYILAGTVELTTEGEYTWEITGQDFSGNNLTDPAGLLREQPTPQKLLVTSDYQSILNTAPPWQGGVYNLITIPVTTYELDHKNALGFFATDTNIVRYQKDAETNNYRYFYYGESGLEAFTPGKGFWLKPGTDETKASQVNGETQTTALRNISLEPGWHLIGNPFNDISLPFDYLSFSYAGQESRYLNAVLDGVVSYGLWSFNHPAYYLERSQMDLWRGYWIYIKKACQLSYHRSQFRSGRSVDPVLWSLELRLQQGNQRGGGSLLGLARMATDGYDLWDAPKPPASLGNKLETFFTIPGRSQQLGADWRGSNSGAASWELVVTGLTPGEAYLTWPGIGAIPADYQLVLVDPQTKKEINLREQANYSFPVTKETSRTFTIKMTNLKTIDLSLTEVRLTPVPFAPLRESLAVSFRLNNAATVEIRIYDWVGNLVYVHSGNHCLAGTNSLWWNGRNNLGQLVANGVYFCKIIAKSGTKSTEARAKLVVVNGL